MFERYTGEARRVVVFAQDDARRLHHPLVGTEHLLLALANQDVGHSAAALHDVRLNRISITEEVERLHVDEMQVAVETPAFTQLSRKVLETAFEESLELGHNQINSGHLLLALLRQSSGPAIEILEKLKVNTDELRQHTVGIVTAGLPQDDQEEVNRSRAQLRALIAGRSVTKAKLAQAFNMVVGNLSYEETRRLLDLLK